ncbi:MAG: chemotaxis protein CheA [Shimia sp.]
MSTDEGLKAGFFEECQELLEGIYDILEAQQGNALTSADIDGIFRAVHTIKGGAGMFALTALVSCAHSLETMLSEIRATKQSFLPPSVISGIDGLAACVAAESDEEDATHGAASTAQYHHLEITGELAHAISSLAQTVSADLSLDLTIVPDDPMARPPRQGTWYSIGPPALAVPVDPKELQAVARTAQRTLRVAVSRIDRLVNLAGEMAIEFSALQQTTLARAETLHAGGDRGGTLARLMAELQDSVLDIRAQPLKPLFQRLQMLARDAARSTGKQIKLHVEGQDVEVDSTVIERLSDGLTHLIRNAVDHGIEPTETRMAAGKSATGNIHISAIQRSGQFRLTIRDDGAGLDRARILEKACDAGLVSPQQEPSAQEIEELIFRPSFSTKDTVSSLSGRGVGMDAVRTVVRSMGGRITVSSTPGHGTAFDLTLPMTLSLLDGMIVRLGGSVFVIPMSGIRATLRLAPANLGKVCDDLPVVRIDDELFPISYLGTALGGAEPPPSFEGQPCLLCHGPQGQPIGLVVDEIEEERQVIVKPLDAGTIGSELVTSATILGDGQIALIVDPLDLPSTGAYRPSVAA